MTSCINDNLSKPYVTCITGATSLYGLIAHPVGHSLSPVLHNTLNNWFEINAVYLPFDIKPENLHNAVKGLSALGVKGFNVTLPFKNEIMKYLDSISPEAEAVQAVNTVSVDGRQLAGYNTDIGGFLNSFEKETGVAITGKRAVIFGAGGTAPAVIAALVKSGIGYVLIVNRTVDKAVILASASEKIAAYYDKTGTSVFEGMSFESAVKMDIFHSCDIIVNTTSAGMSPEFEESPVTLPDAVFRNGQTVFDVIFNPARTLFIKQAESRGCIAVNGLGMLMRQGILAYEIWNSVTVADDMQEKLYKIMAREING
jgi:shikimate dehydrogenase